MATFGAPGAINGNLGLGEVQKNIHGALSQFDEIEARLLEGVDP